jgi:hypothetical protein
MEQALGSKGISEYGVAGITAPTAPSIRDVIANRTSNKEPFIRASPTTTLDATFVESLTTKDLLDEKEAAIPTLRYLISCVAGR